MATAIRYLNGRSEQARACLRKAVECERAAVLAIDPGAQATYRYLAKQWRELVDSYEDLDRLRAGTLQKNDRLALRRASSSSGSQTSA